MFEIMVFAFFFFLGLLAMFIYSERKRENLARNLSDEHAQLRVLLRALESRLDHLAPKGEQPCEQPLSPAAEDNPAQGVEYDPLLHLSFEEPGSGSGSPELRLADEPFQSGNSSRI